MKVMTLQFLLIMQPAGICWQGRRLEKGPPTQLQGQLSQRLMLPCRRTKELKFPLSFALQPTKDFVLWNSRSKKYFPWLKKNVLFGTTR